MNSGGGKVVCVTGASGYIASWVVKLLLDRGYTVKATVRSLDDPKKTEHLRELDGAEERLHLFEANLVEQGAFDSIIQGCDGVFHTASPVTFSVTQPQVEILDPAVKGTLNILRSCTNAKSVKRVVFTSSIVAVLYSAKALESDVEIDETWFSDPKFCEDSKLWYVLSKTLAEGEAWKFAKENGIDLVTMNPCFVIGPLLQPTLNLTCEGILDLIKDTGKKSFYEGNILFVDVRDVAYAHIQAYEIPSASGRYLVVGSTGVDRSELLNIINKLYPDIPLLHNDACSSEEQRVIFPFNKVSNQRVKTLGINFIPLEVSIKDTIESFREKKFISF